MLRARRGDYCRLPKVDVLANNYFTPYSLVHFSPNPASPAPRLGACTTPRGPLGEIALICYAPIVDVWMAAREADAKGREKE